MMTVPVVVSDMPRKKKLDLTNHRFFYKDSVGTVFDSCEDLPIPEILDTAKNHHYNFDSQFGRDKFKPPPIYHSNELLDPPRLNKKGNAVTLTDLASNSPIKSFMNPRPDNSFEYIYNDTAATFSRAERLKSTTSRKIGGVTTLEGYMWKQIKEGKVPGGNWSASHSQRKPLNDVRTQLGPGDYDVTAWERGKHGLHSSGVKFHDVETGRLELEVVPKGSACPSPTYYFRDPAFSPPPSAPTGVLRFDGIPRFADKSPKYLKTTGLLLSGDYDVESAWQKSRANIDIGKQTSPRGSPDPGFQYGVDFINPDVGHKITLKTEVERHHIRHAASFKSKSQMGLPDPRPETGKAGPGEYRGACDRSSIVITLPDNESRAFLSKRNTDIPSMGDQYKTLKPRFQHRLKETIDDHNVTLNGTYTARPLPEPKIPRLGNRGRQKKGRDHRRSDDPDFRMSHVAEFAKTKIMKIYPTMGRKKYS